jgi:hypothetical protein
MHPRAMAARRANAHARLKAAAGTLAERFGATDQYAALTSLRVPGNDAAIRAMAEQEALADLLEAVATSPQPSAAPKARKAEHDASSPA